MKQSTENSGTERRFPLLVVVGAIPAVFIITLLLVGAYLGTDAGRHQLTYWANQRLALESSGIELGQLEGSVFSEFVFSDITVSDEKGPWLEFHRAQVSWAPFDMLLGTLSVSKMHVDEAHLYRLPFKREVAKAPILSGWGIPSLPLDLEVKAFDISNIQVAASLVGAQTSFWSAGNFQISSEDGTVIQARLLNKRGTEEEISIDIVYPQSRDNLSAEVDIIAPRGSVISALLGLSPNHDVEAHLIGSGPADNWSGDFRAQVDEHEIARADVQVKSKALTVRASLDAHDFIPDTGTTLLGRTADFSLDLTPEVDMETAVFSVSLTAETMSLIAEGQASPVDLQPLGAIHYELNVLDVRPFNQLIGSVQLNPFTMTGQFATDKKNSSLSMEFADVSVVDGNRIKAVLGGRFDAIVSADVEGIQINGHGTAKGISGGLIEKTAGSAVLVMPGFHWVVDGDVGGTDAFLSFREVSIENKHLQAQIRGATDQTLTRYNALAKVKVLDGQLLSPAFKSGEILVTLNVNQNGVGEGLIADVTATTDKLSFENKLLSELVGQTPTLAAQVSRTVEGAVKVSDLKLAAQHVTMEGNAGLTVDQQFQQSEFTISFAKLGDLKTSKGMALAGDVQLNGSLGGTLKAPSLTLAAGFNQLDLQYVTLDKVQAHLTALNLRSAPHGSLKVEGASRFGAVQSAVSFEAMESDSFHFTDLSLLLGPYKATGNLIATTQKPLTGNVKVETVGGNATDSIVNAIMEFTNDEGVQGASIQGNLENFITYLASGERVTLEFAEVDASAVFAKAGPLVSLNASAKNLFHPKFQMNRGTLSAVPDGAGFNYKLETFGSSLMPYNLSASGNVSGVDTGVRHVSASLKGYLGKTKVETVAPLEGAVMDKSFSLSPFKLHLGAGFLEGSFSNKNGALQVSFKANEADMTPITLFFPEVPLTGELSGSMQLDTMREQAEGRFSFDLSSIRAGTDAVLLDEGVTVNAQGVLAGESLQFSGSIEMAQALKATYQGTLPVVSDANTPRLSLARDKSFLAEILWQGDIWPLWPALNFVNHDLTGAADARFSIEGTLAAPNVNGHLSLANGRYENMHTGFVASGISMRAAITDSHIELEKLTATDGNNGRITASGMVDIMPSLNFTADASLELDQVHIIRLPKLDVTASSKLAFVKSHDAMKLTGDINVDAADVGALGNNGPSIIELDVQEINHENGNGNYTNGHGRHLGPLALDLEFNAPQKLFIRSYGLDSEWSANVAVAGSSDIPVVSGTASMIRGSFEFSGKLFKLTSGSLNFPGDRSNDPTLDIRAEHEVTGLTAIMLISGRASAPELTMMSTPSLPQDEILSRILFGTSVTELSAIEAVQLASTVHALSTGGGPGLIGSVRRKLGIDRLSIGKSTSEDQGPTITGGKYLTNNIYIEVTTAPATGETATAVEVALTPNLSVVTRRALGNDNNLAIRWSWDY